MKRLCLIPARGGSKRIPRKNIRLFNGLPIIAYSIQAAREAQIFDDVMVSTDDDEIAEISLKYGASIPFRRSPEMSTDMAMTAPVAEEVIQRYRERGKDFEEVCILYPCAPFVTAVRLKQAFELLQRPGAEAVLPVSRFSYPILRSLKIENGQIEMNWPENYNVRSQDLAPAFHDAGQYYALKTQALLEQKRLYTRVTLPLELSELEVQDIDNEDDWQLAELKYRWLKERGLR